MRDHTIGIPAFFIIGLMLGTSETCLARPATTPSALPFSAALPIPDPDAAAGTQNRNLVRAIEAAEAPPAQNTEGRRRRYLPSSEALPFPTTAPQAVDPAAVYNFPNRAMASVDPITATPAPAGAENSCPGFSPAMRDLVSSFWNQYFSYRANVDNPPVPLQQVTQIAFSAAMRDYRKVLSAADLARVEKFLRLRHEQFLVQAANMSSSAKQAGQRLNPWGWSLFVLSLNCAPGGDSARPAEARAPQVTADIEVVPMQLR